MKHLPRQFQKIHHPVSPDLSMASRRHAGRLFMLTQKIRRQRPRDQVTWPLREIYLQLRIKPSSSPSAQASVFSMASPW
jgi:hypothetical protein